MSTQDSAWRQGGSEFVSAAIYALAWIFAPQLGDAWLLALILGAALQLVFVTHYVGGIVPRTRAGWIGLLIGHALLFAILNLMLLRDGERTVGVGSIALAQLPLLMRSLMQLRRPPHTDGHWMLEGFGAFLVLFPALGLAQWIAALLPASRLAARSIPIPPFQSIGADRIEVALLFGAFFFLFLGLGRALWHTQVLRRKDVDPADIARWRRDHERSRGRRR